MAWIEKMRLTILLLIVLTGCGESEKPTQQTEAIASAPTFLPSETVPPEFVGKRGIETWSPRAASFEIGTYVNDRPTHPKPPDAKHVSPFVKTADGKSVELLVSHRISTWDPVRGAWRSSWRWTLAKVIEPGKLQIYQRSPNKEDRPATVADIPVILERPSRVDELR